MVDDKIFIEDLPASLSSEERKMLLNKMKNGSLNAREELIVHNLRLVSQRIYKRFLNYDDKKELFEIGVIGLIKAVDTFKMEKGTEFSSYASKCIDNEILLIFRNQKNEIISLDEPISSKDDKKRSIEDIVVSDIDIEKELLFKEELNELYDAIKMLNKNETELIYLYYFLNYSQEEIATIKNVSRQDISKKLIRALNRLRKILNENNYIRKKSVK